MRKSLNKLNKKAGFTLLELLVVVAILAAIAGTASIALKDTDARAAAAAHVAMMDELNKGIRTYRVLHRNTLPTRFDSLLTTAGTDPGILGFSVTTGLNGDAIIEPINEGVSAIMIAGGLDALMYIDVDYADGTAGTLLGNGTTPCSVANLQDTINSRANMVVAGNIFMSPEANGCGTEMAVSNTMNVVLWAGTSERLTGQESLAGTGTSSAYTDAGNYAYLLTGIGPSSTLFDVNEIGGMTTVPIYRHVGVDEYSRFIAVWNIGTYTGTGNEITAGAQLELTAIIDGALDTKEEELGEWDGTRNTI